MAKKSSSKKDSDAGTEFSEEHRVFSHLMYLLFLISAAIAAFYTFSMFVYPPETTQAAQFYPVKTLVFLGWAFVFKTLGHRIHPPHY